MRSLWPCVAALAALAAAAPPPLPPHPRLIMTPARVADIKAAIATNPNATTFYGLLLQHADWVLTQPPMNRPAPGPSGVLIQVRDSLDFALTSAAAWLLTGNATYGDRAVAEALNAVGANWTDWNPEQHFLDTAEMTTSVGLTLDWMWDYLTPAQIAALQAGILEKGMTQGYLWAYTNKTAWWRDNTINWNCVCAGGGVMGALAIADAPATPAWVWDYVANISRASLPTCIGAYSPEGSWMEGPGYWGYASMYNTLTMASMMSALGEDDGFSDLPGVSLAGSFPTFLAGSSGGIFDWADSETSFGLYPFQQWWGLRFNDSASAFWARKTLWETGSSPNALRSPQWGMYALALAMFSPIGGPEDVHVLPLAKAYPIRMLGVFRTEWAIGVGGFFGCKGGNNTWNHGHLDVGSFVYDYNGQRWAEDMGDDNYGLPGYFGPQRWDYYRLNSQGHNVLLFSNASQSTQGTGPVVAFNASNGQPADGWMVVNTTEAYAGQVTGSVLRGFLSLRSVSQAAVVDEFAAAAGAVNVTWHMHTTANASVASDGSSVTLTSAAGGGVTVTVAVLPQSTDCPGLSGWQAEAVNLAAPQYSTAGTTRLWVTSAMPAACKRIGVTLGVTSTLVTGLSLAPLAQWGGSGPFAAAA